MSALAIRFRTNMRRVRIVYREILRIVDRKTSGLDSTKAKANRVTLTSDQVSRLRAETRGCERVIHFNNAGASLMPDAVYDAVVDHLMLEREIGGYEAAAAADSSLQRLYVAFAELLHARPEEIAFVENATRAWDMGFYGLPLREGDRILTHQSEYASSYLAFLQLAKRRGLEIDVVPSDSHGQIDLDALKGMLRPTTRVINLVHVPTQGGLVNPAEEVGRFAREHGLLYVLDACQSVGQLQVDVAKIGCHLLSGTGRKFLRGPRGTGFLYVSNEIVDSIDPPFIDMRAATWTDASTFKLADGARRFETWESFVAGRVGLAAAVDYALNVGLEAIEQRVTRLAEKLRSSLADKEGIDVRDQGLRKCGIVTFETARETASELQSRLRAEHANISMTPTDSAYLDLGPRGIDELARASVHYYNTESEVERFVDLVSG